jgi:hypothetical protein
MSLGLLPWSQPEDQNKVLFPSLNVMDVHAAKTQAFSGDAHSCHNHLRRSAVANLLRSSTPRPPYSFGRVVLVQFTLHFPP